MNLFTSIIKSLDLFLARACGVPVGGRSGGRLATTLVATINVIIFFFSFLFSLFFFFSVVYFSHRRSARIKKLILRKLTGAPQNLGVDTFLDPVGHFGAHWHAVRRCRRCGVAGSERVPPAPLGWYFNRFHNFFCF